MAQYKLRKPLKAATFNPVKYGLVPNDEVGKDLSLCDPDLFTALDACQAGDWKPATAALAKAGTDWDRRGVYVNALGTAAARIPAWLDSWREAEPSSPDAAVVHAQSLVVKAWDVRGGRYASATTREQFEGFHQILRAGADAAMKAADMATEDPTPWMTMVTAARGLQLPNAEFERIWQELLIRDSMNRRAHLQALQYWQPKWSGSAEQAKSFVEDTIARAPRSALAFQLRLDNQMEIWLPRARLVAQAGYFRRGVGRRTLHEALDAYWDGTAPVGGGQAVLDSNWLAWALTLANRWDDACQAWLAIGGCMSDGSPWKYLPNPGYLFKGLRREAFVMSSLKPTV